jgi:hypothetical protein
MQPSQTVGGLCSGEGGCPEAAEEGGHSRDAALALALRQTRSGRAQRATVGNRSLPGACRSSLAPRNPLGTRSPVRMAAA